MKTFKTLEEMRAYHRPRSLAYYHKKMADPIKAELYRIKRRVYEKKRYKQIMDKLKTEAT